MDSDQNQQQYHAKEFTDIDSILNGDIGKQQNESALQATVKVKPKKLIRESSLQQREIEAANQTVSAKGKLRRKSIDIQIKKSVDSDIQSASPTQPKPRHSVTTTERSAAAKIYFEHYFERLFTGKSSNPTASSSRNRRRIHIEQELDRLGLPDSEKSKIREEWISREHHLTRLSREKMTTDHFEAIKPLGKGAYGTVQLVKEKSSGVIYAMKILVKEHMLRENQESHVRAERDLLSEAASNDRCHWLVKLVYSFQDIDCLFFVMEYLAGGDLLSLLIRQDIFPEEMARFYAAEMLLCIEETHKLGYVHRDIKPDNFLIDGRGHLKLGDCGLATDFHWSHDSKYYELVRKQAYKASKFAVEENDSVEVLESERQELDDYIKSTEDASREFLAVEQTIPDAASASSSEKKEALVVDALLNPPPSHKILTWRARSRMEHPHARNYSIVGTNNYIAVEVLQGQPYDFSCDWWSFAVIVFEMLYGYPFAASKTREGTRMKILEWRKWLKFPSYVTRKDSNGYMFAGEVSREARDLIRKIICDNEERLGSAYLIAKSEGTALTEQDGREVLPFTQILNMMLLGKDAAEVKKHGWFKSIDFDRIIEKSPPWTPELKNDMDTKYFDDAAQDIGLSGPYAIPLGKASIPPSNKTSAASSTQNISQAAVQATELETIQSANNSNVQQSTCNQSNNEEDGEMSQSLLDLRKRLAFVGFTFKGSASVTNRVEALKTGKLSSVMGEQQRRPDSPTQQM